MSKKTWQKGEPMTQSVIAIVGDVKIEVRIVDEQIEKVIRKYHGEAPPEDQTFMRGERRKIQESLVWIFKGNYEKFKEILHKIGKDETYFAYGKKRMDDEKERRVHKLKAFEEKTQKKRKALQEMVDKYTWSE